jgi:hypothetical protein
MHKTKKETERNAVLKPQAATHIRGGAQKIKAKETHDRERKREREREREERKNDTAA